MPSTAGSGLLRSTSVGRATSAGSADHEAKRMREMIHELSLKLDTLLAKQ